jgi:hypothetical protein
MQLSSSKQLEFAAYNRTVGSTVSFLEAKQHILGSPGPLLVRHTHLLCVYARCVYMCLRKCARASVFLPCVCIGGFDTVLVEIGLELAGTSSLQRLLQWQQQSHSLAVMQTRIGFSGCFPN